MGPIVILPRSCAPRVAALLFVSALAVACGGGGGSSGSTPFAHSQGFYVDSVGGDDANTGKDSAHPWRTLAKVSGTTFTNGSVVYLKRGDTWNEQLTIPSSGITIDAYGSGANPIIDGSSAISGSWSSLGGGVYGVSLVLAPGEALGNVSEAGVLMTFVPWQGDAGTTFAAAGAGTYSYEYPSTVYVKTASNPNTNGKVYRASVKLYGIDATSVRDVVVRNVTVTRFSLHGVQFKHCVRCEIHDAAVSQGGGATIAAGVYAGNGIEFGDNVSDGLVDGLTVSDIFDSGISPQTYDSGRTMSGITIRNSQISRCGFAGIEVSVLSNGGTTGSSISGVTISGVTVSDSGRGWSGQRYGTEGRGIRVKADAGAGTMNGVQIDTTTVDHSVGDGVMLAGEIGAVALSRVEIKRNAIGVNLSDATAASAKLRLTSSLVHNNTGAGVLYNAPNAAGFELLQDTFSNNTGFNVEVLNQQGTAKIENNIFFGTAAMTHLYVDSTLFGATVDYNCYTEGANMVGYDGTAYATVAAFQAGTGFEAHGLGGTVVALDLSNPSAPDPAPSDFGFPHATTSVCKWQGDATVGIVADFSGYAYHNPPSTGAWEYR